MDDKPNRTLVDSHSEADGRNDDRHDSVHPVVLDLLLLVLLQSRVVSGTWQAELAQRLGDALRCVLLAAVDDAARFLG